MPQVKRPVGKIGNKYYSTGLQNGLKLQLGARDNNATKSDDEDLIMAKPVMSNKKPGGQRSL